MGELGNIDYEVFRPVKGMGVCHLLTLDSYIFLGAKGLRSSTLLAFVD